MKFLDCFLVLSFATIICLSNSPAQSINLNGNDLTGLTEIYFDTADLDSWNQQVKRYKRELKLIFNTGPDHLIGSNNSFSAVLRLEIIAQDIDSNNLKLFPPIEMQISSTQPEQVYILEFQSLDEIHHFKITKTLYDLDPQLLSLSFLNSHINLSISSNDILGFGIFNKNFKPIVPTNLTVSPCTPCFSDEMSKVFFSWELPDGNNQYFNSYDLEILKVEPYSDGTVQVDWNRASTIEINDTTYAMTLTEGTGFYLWRVRGIGNFYSGGRTDRRNYGEWSVYVPAGLTNQFYSLSAGLLIPQKLGLEINPSTSSPNRIQNNHIYYNQFNDSINWIYNRVYTEGGRQSETISFANGLNQVQQVQTKLFSSNQVLTTQYVNDYSGRPALQSLPAPVNDNKLGYKNWIFNNQAGQSYSAVDFDENTSRYDPEPLEDPRSTVGSINHYYSDDNTLGEKSQYVPSAEGYPYTRTIYFNDPLGRVQRISSPGEANRINRGSQSHNTSYNFSGASPSELDRIFGNEAPLNNTVYKQITKDPNNLTSISYFSQNGQILATSLSQAVETPALENVGNEESNANVTILGPGIYYEEDFVSKNKTTLFIEEEQKTIYFDYKIKPSFFKSSCIEDPSQEFCYTCDYRVEIDISYPAAPLAIGRNVKLWFIIEPSLLALCNEQDYISFDTPGFPTINYSEPPQPGDPEENVGSIIPASSTPDVNFTLLQGTYLVTKRVYVNNKLFPTDPGYVSNTNLNPSYLEKYKDLYNQNADNWTLQNNCCGPGIIDTIGFDCEGISPFCADIIGDNFSEDDSDGDGLSKFTEEFMKYVFEERRPDYKEKLTGEGENLFSSDIVTTDLIETHYRIQNLLSQLVIDANISCDQLSDCFLIASSQLENNIQMSNLEGAAEMQYLDGDGLPISNPETDDQGNATPLYDPEFDFLKTFLECLGYYGTGLTGSYYVGPNFDNFRDKRIDRQIKFNWEGGRPLSSLPSNGFSILWEGTIHIPKDGDYIFYLSSDDGSRLFLNGETLDNWGDHDTREVSKVFTGLSYGKHKIEIEYYENGGDADIVLMWEGPGFAKQIVPFYYLYCKGSECSIKKDIIAWHTNDPSPRDPDILYLQVPRPSGNYDSEPSNYEEMLDSLTCLESYFYVKPDPVSNLMILEHKSDYYATREEAIQGVCECLFKQDEIEPAVDDAIEMGELISSRSVSECEDRCESKRGAFKAAILSYIEEQNNLNGIDSSDFDIDCLIDIMVQQCKSQCRDLRDAEIDLDTLIDINTEEKVRDYLNSENFQILSDQIAENFGSYLEAFFDITRVAPVGRYRLGPDLQTSQEEIIDFIYSSLEKGINQRIKTEYYNHLTPPTPYSLTFLFDLNDPSTTIPFDFDSLVYRQDIKSFLYPIYSVTDTSYKIITVVVNTIWDEGSDTSLFYRKTDDKVLQYDISFYCRSNKIAFFSQYATVQSFPNDICYLSALYPGMNYSGFNLKGDLLEIYFDNTEFLHIVPKKLSCDEITDINNVNGTRFSGISPYSAYRIFSFELQSTDIDCGLRIGIDENGVEYSLIEGEDVNVSEYAPGTGVEQNIIEQINKSNTKYYAYLGDPNLTNPPSNEIFIVLSAKNVIEDPSSYSLILHEYGGDIVFANESSRNYVLVTPLSSLMTNCPDTIPGFGECPYGYLKVEGTQVDRGIVLEDYVLNGDAAFLPTDDGFLLTPDSTMMRGSIWNTNKINLDEPFEKEFKVYLGHRDMPGGHGIAFLFHSDSLGLNALGGYGQSMGFGEVWGRAIKPSLAIEIDTHADSLDFRFDRKTNSQLLFKIFVAGRSIAPVTHIKDVDHITLTADGKVGENLLVLPVPARNDRENIEDARIHTFKIVWSGKGSNRLEVYFDEELRLSIVKDIKSEIFSDNDVWWGWTGATGKQVRNLQWVKPIPDCEECKKTCEICMDWISLPQDLFKGDYPPVQFYDCQDLKLEYINDQTEFYLKDCLETGISDLINSYKNNCTNFDDELVISDTTGYHNFTLYYYDRAGNLIKTVPPAGVDFLDETAIANVQSHRNSEINPPEFPQHRLITTYNYNSIKQLTSQKTPDGGTTRFWYNVLGQQVLSQDAAQNLTNRFSYVRYDRSGRIIENGELLDFIPNFLDSEQQIIGQLWDNIDFPMGEAASKRDITVTEYNEPTTGLIEYKLGMFQSNLRNRISHSWRDEDGDENTLNDQFHTYYSYDPHGNVEWSIHEFHELGRKKIRYEYDIVSGNVNRIIFQENTSEQYIHRYEYDEDNRLLAVFTSKDGIIWDRDAKYLYYNHGPLSRVEIGEDKIQGVDYTYTVEGYLKSINQVELEPQRDPGRDGTDATGFIEDEFAMELSYYEDDYERTNSKIGSDNGVIDPFGASLIPDNQGLYNGNICAWGSNLRSGIGSTAENPIGIKTNLYRYDKLNRLRSVDFKLEGYSGFSDPGRTYDEEFTYDANGNIKTVKRYGWSGYGRSGDFLVDNLTYNYNIDVSNRLTHIDEDPSVGSFGTDMDDQASDNYQYDEEGKLISDISKSLTITWNKSDKVSSVTNNSTNERIDFKYNILGYRSTKNVFDLLNNEKQSTWYIRDIQGNIIAIYTKTFDISTGFSIYKLSELPIYGSSRIGVYRPDLEIQLVEDIDESASVCKADTSTELSNWLIATTPMPDGNSGAKLSFSLTQAEVMDESATENLGENDLFMGKNVAIAEDDEQQKVFEFFVSNSSEVPTLINGLRGEYYDNIDLSGIPKTVITESKIDFDWLVTPPAGGLVNMSQFGARWTGKLKIDYSDLYKLRLWHLGGIRLYIDNVLILNKWTGIDISFNLSEVEVDLESGYCDLIVEYFNAPTDPSVGGGIKLSWQRYVRRAIQDYLLDDVHSKYFLGNEPYAGPVIFERREQDIYFRWQDDLIEAILNRKFSARFDCNLIFPPSDSVRTLHLKSNTGVRLSLYDHQVLNKWKNRSYKEFKYQLDLPSQDTTIMKFQLDLQQDAMGLESLFSIEIGYWTSYEIIPQEKFYHYPPDVSWLLDNSGQLVDTNHEITACREMQSAIIKIPGQYNNTYYLFTGNYGKLFYHKIYADPYYAELISANNPIGGLTYSEINSPYALAIYNDLTDENKNRLFTAVNKGTALELYEIKVTPENIKPERRVERIEGNISYLGEMQISPVGDLLAIVYGEIEGGREKNKLALFDIDPNIDDMVTSQNVLILDDEPASDILKRQVLSFDFSSSGKYIYYLRQDCNTNDCYEMSEKPVKLMRIDYSDVSIIPQFIMEDTAERFSASIRRSKTRKLFLNYQLVRPPTESTQKLRIYSNLDAPNIADIQASESVLQHNKGKNRFGLPQQSYRINPQQIKSDINFQVVRNLNKKLYEITDHLQNIRAVIGDARNADVISNSIVASFDSVYSWFNYYAFGSLINGLCYQPNMYRFGFNGMEKDNEISGVGNSYTAFFWQYSPRLGRRWNIDPVKKPWESSYVCFLNNPIKLLDPSGLLPLPHVAEKLRESEKFQRYEKMADKMKIKLLPPSPRPKGEKAEGKFDLELKQIEIYKAKDELEFDVLETYVHEIVHPTQQAHIIEAAAEEKFPRLSRIALAHMETASMTKEEYIDYYVGLEWEANVIAIMTVIEVIGEEQHAGYQSYLMGPARLGGKERSVGGYIDWRMETWEMIEKPYYVEKATEAWEKAKEIVGD